MVAPPYGRSDQGRAGEDSLLLAGIIAEAIGARDHWAAETALGQRLAEPSLDRAVAAIRTRAHASPMSS